MDAIIISVKGDLKPIGLRHHIYRMGNTLGICGFLNYRNGMTELLIHAEGENHILVEFKHQINQLANEHMLGCSMESAMSKDFTDFKISHMEVSLNHNFEDSNKITNTDIINIPFAKAQISQKKNTTTYNKSQKFALRELFSFIKHTGLW